MPRWLPPLLAALASLALFLPGLTWGLPSRDADAFLFGDREPWTGEQLVALAGTFDEAAAADVDRDAGDDAWLNDTDAERAEIVMRYRLYSQQPDEMLTLRAIASMAARRSPDPQFYTYGGLWTYPVAALIGAASVVGLIERGDLAFYLDHPSEFAKMYVVMRLYAVAWAALGAASVCVLARRLTRSAWLGLAAAGVYATMPVVVVAAREAKPHLPGAVLALVAVAFADAYRTSGRRRDLAWCGLWCGAAAGMVVTMAVAFLLLPTAWLLRRQCDGVNNAQVAAARRAAVSREAIAPPDPTRLPPVGRQLPGDRSTRRFGDVLISCGVGLLVFAATNPFLLLNPGAVAANASNTAAHYGFHVLAAAWVGLELFGQASGRLAGFVGVLVLLAYARPRAAGRRGTLFLLAVPAGIAFVGFALTAVGRPGDHARFALLPAIVTAVASVGGVGLAARTVRRPARRLVLVVTPIALLAVTVAVGGGYVRGFVNNARGIVDGRMSVAADLAALDGGDLQLPADPAPYAVPPFDLWRWRATTDDLNEPGNARLLRLPDYRQDKLGISFARLNFRLLRGPPTTRPSPR